MRKKLFEEIIILDRSGSMSSIKDDMEGGMREQVKELKKQKGVEIRLTYCTFDDKYEVQFTSKDLKKVEEKDLCLQPRGNTALLDAVGKMINETQERLDKIPKNDQPLKVTFMIITDGHENASREFNIEQIKKMVEHQKNSHGWEFNFLGANIDAFSTGSMLGFSNSVNYKSTKIGAKAMFTTLTKSRGIVYDKAASASDDMLDSMDFSSTIDDAAVLAEEEKLEKEEANKKK